MFETDATFTAALERSHTPVARLTALSPDGSTVFTANGPSNDVSIVDVASRTVKAKVPVGDRPWGIVFVP